MTKAKISEYDAVASNNTDVNGVNIAEGCPPSGMNNMGREIMAALKRFQVGSDGDGVTVGGNLVVSGSSTVNTFTAGPVSATTLNTSGAVVFNDAGADVDFRVEGDTDANLLFVDAGNDRVGVKTSSPAVAFDVVGQVRASTGILFGTDTAAANALDDYEEGTWTPGVGGTATYTIQRGSYTKVGRLITVNFDIGINTIGTGSTTTITLPFASGISFNNGGCSGTVRWFESSNVNATFMACYVETNNSSLEFAIQNASDDSTPSSAQAIFKNSTRVAGTMTYMTS